MPVYVSLRAESSDNAEIMRASSDYTSSLPSLNSSYQEILDIGAGVRTGKHYVMIQNGEPTAIVFSSTTGSTGVDTTAQHLLAGQGIKVWMNANERLFFKTA